MVHTDRNSSTVIVESRFIGNRMNEALLTGIHATKFQGSTVSVERCAFVTLADPNAPESYWLSQSCARKARLCQCDNANFLQKIFCCHFFINLFVKKKIAESWMDILVNQKC